MQFSVTNIYNKVDAYIVGLRVSSNENTRYVAMTIFLDKSRGNKSISLKKI